MLDEENNLLARLHKWAERQDENFLTDAFAHLLRHLRDKEPQVAFDILCQLTGGRLPDIEAERIRNTLTIRTQVTTEQGRPDIEIAIPGIFLGFVEAKVESNVHKKQVERYLKELKRHLTELKNVVPKIATSLVLLTRYPVELAEYSEYVDQLFFCRWYQIAGWLETEYNKEGRITRTEIRFLTNQFVEFLKIRNIAMEKAGPELVPGLKSLRNILRMLEEAIIAKTGRATGYCKFVDDRDYIGFNLDKKKFFVGIDYEEPTKLFFETQDFPVREDAKERAGFGEFEMDEGGWGLMWLHELELEPTFFALPKDEQIKSIFDFVDKCLEATRKIKKGR